ncbi:NAD-dependent epimerase/dehydratase family protein [Candidatus Curtissbacteria bacterium]|nr:NAD-dependent epimerase/dehydratase family protein [Candidatus Curtissbacteria bacterium]
MKNNRFKGKNVLVTGGLGFIGSNLAIELVGQGARVEVLDALIPDMGGNRFNIHPILKNIKVTIADMRNRLKVKKAIKDKEIIFNLAGTLSHVDSMTNPFLDLEINCNAQLCLLEACRQFNPSVKIVFAGTRNQYGRTLYSPVDEKHLQEPTDINGINSIAAEKYHLLYGKIYGIKTTSLRMTNTYGPRHQMHHPKQGVLNWFIRQLIDGEEIKLFGDGTQIRDVNYVSDVVDALMLAAVSAKSNGEVYNLGGCPITLRGFVEECINIYGRGSWSLIKFPKDRKAIEIGNYIADIKKIREDLGWQPKVDIQTAIAMTIDYYLKNKKHYF